MAFLSPILSNTLQNATTLGTEKALTGPISRGDIETIKSHLQALTKASDQYAHLYKKIGIETLKLSTRDQPLLSEVRPEISNLFEEINDG